MSINHNRSANTGNFKAGSRSISASSLNKIGQYLDQSRVGILHGSVRPTETPGGTIIEFDGGRRGGLNKTIYHPWKLIPKKNNAGDYEMTVWPGSVNNLVPKFMGSKLDAATKPKKKIEAGVTYYWLEVKGQEVNGYYTFPKEDGETPLVLAETNATKGAYDDKAYLLLGSVNYTKKKDKTETEPAVAESIVVTQLATLSVWVERLKCGTSPAEYYWSH